MDIIRIKDETHKVAGTIYLVRGNMLSGNWTSFHETDDPDILYRKDFRDGQEYTEEFVRRDKV